MNVGVGDLIVSINGRALDDSTKTPEQLLVGLAEQEVYMQVVAAKDWKQFIALQKKGSKGGNGRTSRGGGPKGGGGAHSTKGGGGREAWSDDGVKDKDAARLKSGGGGHAKELKGNCEPQGGSQGGSQSAKRRRRRKRKKGRGQGQGDRGDGGGGGGHSGRGGGPGGKRGAGQQGGHGGQKGGAKGGQKGGHRGQKGDQKGSPKGGRSSGRRQRGGERDGRHKEGKVHVGKRGTKAGGAQNGRSSSGSGGSGLGGGLVVRSRQVRVTLASPLQVETARYRDYVARNASIVHRRSKDRVGYGCTPSWPLEYTTAPCVLADSTPTTPLAASASAA